MKSVTKQYIMDRAIPVPDAGCWIWELSQVKGGYGKVCIDNKTLIASRVAWEVWNGEIPDGLIVCHKCDTPACVNPNHLFLGTARENTDDMLKKARQAKGEKSPMAKLTSEIVIKLRNESGSHDSIAKKYGLKRGVVRQVRIGETWRHLL